MKKSMMMTMAFALDAMACCAIKVYEGDGKVKFNNVQYGGFENPSTMLGGL